MPSKKRKQGGSKASPTSNSDTLLYKRNHSESMAAVPQGLFVPLQQNGPKVIDYGQANALLKNNFACFGPMDLPAFLKKPKR